MTQYNETMQYSNYVKMVCDAIDKSIVTLIHASDTQRTDEIRKIVLDYNFNYDAWIRADTDEMTRDAIEVKINDEFITVGAKYFDNTIKELLSKFGTAVYKPSTNNALLNGVLNDILKTVGQNVPAPKETRDASKDDWIRNGVYNG